MKTVPALLDWWKTHSVAERKAAAKRLKTSYVYLSNVCHSRKRLGWENANRYAQVLGIERAKIAPYIWGEVA